MAAKRGRPKAMPNLKEMLSKYIPASDIFSEDERTMYEGLINIYLQDFDEDQLTANDLDDILSISMNRVLEFRLLKSSKNDSTAHIDASSAIEKIRRQTDKLKENLANRRRDRVDPKKFSGFSIVDLAASFDNERKSKLLKLDGELIDEERDILEADEMVGNQMDGDIIVISEESD